MNGGIFLVRDNDELVEMSEQLYDSEDRLQGLLAKYPNLLAGDQIDVLHPRRWLLVKQEMGLASDSSSGSRWSVDHLFLDQDGIPTIVEVKRSTNTQIRREIVGQILEYAANALVHWPVEKIIADFQTQHSDEDPNTDQLLSRFLQEEQTAKGFWQAVETNLQAGRIRLVIVADTIPPELRRIVEFLNEQMDPADIFAIEVKQFIGEDKVALAPRLIGSSERKNIRRGTREKRQWDEASHFAELEQRGGRAAVGVARSILEWARSAGLRIWWGQGKRSGSFVPTFDYMGKNHQLFAIWTDAKLELYFYAYKNKPPFDDLERRRGLMQRLNQIPGITVPEDAIDRGPGLRLGQLEEDAVLQQFISVYEWFLEEIRKT